MSKMSKEQMQAFRRRAERHQRAHARGERFEAVGTLGRGELPVARRGFAPPVLRPLLLLLLVSFLIKTAITVQLGPDLQAQRADRLKSGTLAERIGAVFLTPDPVTAAAAREIRRLY